MGRKRKKRRKKKSASCPHYCDDCRKVVWPTLESADSRVAALKEIPGAHKPYLLNAYRCPVGKGWHIGHNYKLQWISLCIGEHK